jgi:hypothetical protein
VSDIVLVALIGAVAALGTPWMNALATRWVESNKRKKPAKQQPRQQAQPQTPKSSFERAVAAVLSMPLYAIAIWMFLISPGEFSDHRPLNGIMFLIISVIFAVAAHYTSEWLTRPPQSN